MSIAKIRNYVQATETIATSGQPLEDQFPLIRQSGYQAVINIAMPDSEGALVNEGHIVTGLGMAYFHIPVPFEAPTVEQLRLFIGVMECLQGKKVWAHCIANYRVSAFMYQYRKTVYGVAPQEAKSSIFELWQPDAVWQQIMDLHPDEIAF